MRRAPRLHLLLLLAWCSALGAALPAAEPGGGVADGQERAKGTHAGAADFYTTPPMALSIEGVPRAVRFNELVLAGNAPPSGEGFEQLAREGVRTLVSIDHPAPDAASAADAGIRTVHLPVRHGRANAFEVLQVVRAASFLSGGYYIHAGPGEDRVWPVAVVVAGWIERQGPARRRFLLAQLGVPNTRADLDWDVTESGLFDDRELVRSLPPYFPPASNRVELVAFMRDVAESFDRLRDAAGNGWQPPPEHPEMTAQFDAGALRESFANWESIAWPGEGRQFADGFARTAALAGELRAALESGDGQASDRAWESLRMSCLECHVAHRDGAP